MAYAQQLPTINGFQREFSLISAQAWSNREGPFDLCLVKSDHLAGGRWISWN